MNELTCRTETCDNIVECDSDVVSVTCGNCCVLIGVECND